jgi:hypothetical protein
MDDQRTDNPAPDSADGVTERETAIPASEEGTGIIPEDEGEGAGDTRVPASEDGTGMIPDADPSPPQSWPGAGDPGSIPPPG